MHQGPRYLLPESLSQLKRLLIHHPVLGTLLILIVYGGVLQILRWRFRRADADVLAFAGVVSTITLVVLSALYTVFHVNKGFHLG